VLTEESLVLSSSKRTMEQQLATLKTSQQNLDKTRKDIEDKMSILGRALTLDSQNFKVKLLNFIENFFKDFHTMFYPTLKIVHKITF